MNLHSFFSKIVWIDFFKRYVFKFLLFTLLSSCLSPLDFLVEIKGGVLVVTGQISTISDQNIIQLGITANIEQLPFPESGASIQLYDNVGKVYLYEEDFQNLSTYYLRNVSGVAGRTYYIQIDLSGGESYKSLPEKLPEPAVQESVSYDIVRKELTDKEGAVVFEDYIELFSNSKLLSTKNPTYLKWGVEEAFLLSPTDFPDIFGVIPDPCFVVQNADPQRIILLNGSEVSVTSINNILVATRVIDWSFLERHYFTIYQSSITKESYDYWRKVNIVANQVGTIFDTPPATIIGNMVSEGNPKEKALGYFQAINQTFYDYDAYPVRCIDCASVRNSSYNRPDWF